VHNADLLDAGVSPITAAKAHRLLKAIRAAAAEDGLIGRNPCRVTGPESTTHPQRPRGRIVARVWHAKDIQLPLMIVWKAHADRLSCAFGWRAWQGSNLRPAA